MSGTRDIRSLINIALFTFIVTFVVLSFACTASAESTIEFSPVQLKVEENAEFTLDIVITPDVNTSGAELELSYDPDLISITSITEGDIFKQSGKSTIFSRGTIDNDAGIVNGVYCAILGNDMPLDPGTFATITFSSKEISGVTEVEMKNVILTNSAGEKLPVNINNAMLAIGDAEIIAEEQEEIEATSDSQQTGQNTLVPLVFALMCIYFIKRR
ncbi:cohesin domain-containing protein [Methanolobus sp. WCC4]|uniref:cohesin domain-containing protein n=1 Tax=Methanolobus sp. WCC4 TaxID=3125784 RepID=UPI0030FC8570